MFDLSRIRRGLCIAPAVLSILATPVLAAELTPAQRDGLSQTVSSFAAATRSNDMAKVFDILPPRLADAMAKTAGIATGELRTVFARQIGDVLKAVRLVSFSMDAAQARVLELPNGEAYAVIPTETVIETAGGKVQTTSETLAIMDQGAWYLLRVNNAGQVQMFTQVYPQFAGVAFKADTVKVVP